jgi:hypothetical protein
MEQGKEIVIFMLKVLGTTVQNLASRATFLLIFLQLRGPATALSSKFLRDLTTARHFKRFLICIIRIFTTKIEKFQLRGNNSVWAGAFHLLRGRAPAQLRGRIFAGRPAARDLYRLEIQSRNKI